MIIGFTGTRKGMTEFQKKEVELILIFHRGGTVHHGDCIGADAEFHLIAKKYSYMVIVHPASGVGKQRAYCSGVALILPTKPPLIRNHLILDSCDIMIATPAQYHEIMRSGTWATIRYAKKIGKIIHVIYPGGK